MESGTHADLVALGARYAALWRAQMWETADTDVV
jgi:ABC-type multidrug transport system fused ATPase/permease subunit